MAEGWVRHLAGSWLEVESAGIEAHGKNPRAVGIMAEAGIDISGQESKQWTREMLDWADMIITVCGHAEEQCPSLPEGKMREHWPLEDPARATGTESQIMDKFRKVRDDIELRVENLIKRLEQERGKKP